MCVIGVQFLSAYEKAWQELHPHALAYRDFVRKFVFIPFIIREILFQLFTRFQDPFDESIFHVALFEMPDNDVFGTFPKGWIYHIVDSFVAEDDQSTVIDSDIK